MSLTILEAESFKQRLERMYEYQDKRHKWPNIVAVRSRPEGRNTIIKESFLGNNIVTNDGDIYYSIKGAGGSPATNENFIQGRLELRTSSATPAKADTYAQITGVQSTTRHAIDAGYPKTPDTDTDNTAGGSKIVSYRYSYLTSEGNVNGILGGAIHDNASPVSGTKLLCHFTISTFDKTNSDTMKFFCNHS